VTEKKGVPPRDREEVPPEEVLDKVRIPFVQKAAVTCKGVTQEAFTIDVGLTGVFVERSEPLPIGEPVIVSFGLPGYEHELTARCRVAWWYAGDKPLPSKSLPPGVGLQFVDLPEADLRRVRELVVEHCRQHPRVRRFLRHWPEAELKGDDP
jgi:Tfp pilus assembly protein PilZ